VGKIDNDFNISESDWIPRVAAWTIDALSQMKVLPMERKRRTLEVSDKVAQFPCEINGTELKVFDKSGNEIPELNSKDKGNCCNKQNAGSGVFAVFDPTAYNGINSMVVVDNNTSIDKNFVLDCNKIELSFDTDSIDVETYEVVTYHDDYYDCECPYIYDDGLLLEALSWYCMYKYLSRGSQHPVFSLQANSPILNPWVQWNNLRPKAAASVKSKIFKDSGWNNFFYNSTFLPRS
jgi:hypothetical protein